MTTSSGLHPKIQLVVTRISATVRGKLVVCLCPVKVWDSGDTCFTTILRESFWDPNHQSTAPEILLEYHTVDGSEIRLSTSGMYETL